MTLKIVILGGGPAGLGLALRLLRRTDLQVEVTVIEKESYVGGLTAGFESHGLQFDFGSHRLHPNTDPEILQDISALLGSDLLSRPRNGRIRLLGRFIRFPLNPVDLIFYLPFSFVCGFLTDMFRSFFCSKKTDLNTYQDVLLAGLGNTICHTFYFPYAEKLWGFAPDKISAVQAYRRVKAHSFTKIIEKVLTALPGLKPKNSGIFYYPKNGYRQIAESMAHEVQRLGGVIRLSSCVNEIRVDSSHARSVGVTSDEITDSAMKKKVERITEKLSADLIFSTIPITDLCTYFNPSLPENIVSCNSRIRYRSMVLCYFVLQTDQFTLFDAHYFPEKEFLFSRISESKNYAAQSVPEGITGLCIEIPCDTGDAIWNTTTEILSERILADMRKAGLPVTVSVKEISVKRLRHVYPVYDLEYQSNLKQILDYLNTISGLITLGRQGLFAHDNTHHTIETAYRACDSVLDDNSFDHKKWAEHRKRFEQHIVED